MCTQGRQPGVLNNRSGRQLSGDSPCAAGLFPRPLSATDGRALISRLLRRRARLSPLLSPCSTEGKSKCLCVDSSCTETSQRKWSGKYLWYVEIHATVPKSFIWCPALSGAGTSLLARTISFVAPADRLLLQVSSSSSYHHSSSPVLPFFNYYVHFVNGLRLIIPEFVISCIFMQFS